MGKKDTVCKIKWSLQKVWHRVKNILEISGALPFTELWNNRQLVEFAKIKEIGFWIKRGITKVSDIVGPSGLKRVNELMGEQCTFMDTFKFTQLKSAYESTVNKGLLKVQGDEFMEYCVSNNKEVRYKISQIYSKLRGALGGGTVFRSTKKWKAALGVSERCWPEIFKNIRHATQSINYRLIQFKIVHELYYTPRLLNKMSSRGRPAQCWKCGYKDADSLHLLWGCGEVQKFWEQFTRSIFNMIGRSWTPDCKSVILGLGLEDDIRGNIKREWLKGCLVAKVLLVRYWGTEVLPSLAEWEQLMYRISIYEKLRNN